MTEELLYLETDGSCANCGVRDSRVLTIHHIERADDAKDEWYDNKILLCHNCHQCHHQGKGPSVEDLWRIKRRLIVKTLTQPGLNALKQAYRRSSVVAMPFLVNHLVELGYLVLEVELSAYCHKGRPDAPIDACYTITPAGKALLERWGLK